MSSDQKRDYEVGYGKPPVHTRYRKGQSGNPRGRPAGAKNLSTLLTEALNEPVVVVEDGGRRKISKRQAMITQLVNQSVKGDLRAVKLLIDIEQGRGAADRVASRFPPPAPELIALDRLSDVELAALERFVDARLAAKDVKHQDVSDSDR
jgi:hypothetical protein